MSHNTVKLNNKKPDKFSDFTVTSTSGPQNIIYIGGGASVDYSTAYNAELYPDFDKLHFYDENPINTIEGSSISNIENGGANWYNKIIVPPGKYIVECQFFPKFSATGFATFSINETSGRGSNISVTSNGTFSTWGNPYLSKLYIDTTQDYEIYMKFYVPSIYSSNVASKANQGTTPSERSWIKVVGVKS